MKKTIFYLLLTISFVGISQTLEKSYKSEGINNNPKNYAFITESGIKYIEFGTGNWWINIYDEKHSLYKDITLKVPNGFSLEQLYFATDKLFNSDNNIEILLGLKSHTDTERKMLLFNEEGDVIFDFGNKFKADVFKDQNNNFKIMTSLSTNISYPEVHYDIYSLDGTLSVIQEEFLSKQKIISFPNPSSNMINITNPLKNNEKEKIEVYDINGRKVLEKEIIGNGENIELNISNLSTGIYNYRIRNYENKFMKE